MGTEDTDATNELINDGQFVQPLTATEIEALKQSGVHASVTPHILALALILMGLMDRRISSRNRLRCTQIILSRLNTAKTNTKSERQPSKWNKSSEIRPLSLQVKVF
jgi:hypothetical protein